MKIDCELQISATSLFAFENMASEYLQNFTKLNDEKVETKLSLSYKLKLQIRDWKLQIACTNEEVADGNHDQEIKIRESQRNVSVGRGNVTTSKHKMSTKL